MVRIFVCPLPYSPMLEMGLFTKCEEEEDDEEDEERERAIAGISCVVELVKEFLASAE